MNLGVSGGMGADTDCPWPHIAAFLISVTEDAIRLRSSSPFTGILTQEERARILEAFNRD